jgi:ABC-type antimicrobial peptide transport system permease subunit
LAGLVQQVVRDTLTSARIGRVTTLVEQMNASIVLERLVATLAGWFGALGILLAAIGLYGLLAYSVVRRTKEIGIRMALGATVSNVTMMVVKGALQLVVAGLVVAVPLAFWGERTALSLMGHLPPSTAIAAALVAVVMTGAALMAAYLPARRAASITPIDALRHE